MPISVRHVHWTRYCLMMVTLIILALPINAADKIKDFKRLATLDGKELTLEDVQDKATLIAFFFPTCTYCNKALPETVRVYEKYKGQGLSMVWINIVEEEEELIPEWLSSHQYDVRVLTGASTQYIARRYDVEMTPEHLIINSDQEILFRQRGYEAGYEAELESQVRVALGL